MVDTKNSENKLHRIQIAYFKLAYCAFKKGESVYRQTASLDLRCDKLQTWSYVAGMEM